MVVEIRQRLPAAYGTEAGAKGNVQKKGRISRVWSPDLMFGRTWSDADEMSLADPAGTCLQVTKSQTLHSALI